MQFNMKLTVLIALIGITASGAEDQTLTDFAAGNAQFTAEVYQKLTKSNSGNIVVCPLSVATILALVHAGARGETASQISSTLHLPASPDKIREIFGKLKVLQHHGVYILNSANKIYVNNGFQISDQFKSTAVGEFKSDIQNIDLNKKQEAAAEMNKWVESKTLDKIKDLIKPEDLNANPIAVLINTMYFEASWQSSFEEEDTKKRPFNLSDQKQVDVEMMEQTSYFNYHESDELKAKFLELPYAGEGAGRDASMVFVLPNDKDGLRALEARMGDVLTTKLDKWPYVHVQVPKFKIENIINFNSILRELGIVDAFEDNADFSGILASKAPLKISKVLQKAFIEVHEKGTVATAATFAMAIPASMPPPPKQFIADHPFLYFIKVKGIIIFAGRYSLPQA